MFHSRS